MVVERDGAVEFGEWDPEAVGDRSERLVREVSVPIVKFVQQGQKRRRLVSPASEEILV